jgi:hypothetical protein
LLKDENGKPIINPAYKQIVDDKIAAMKAAGDIKGAQAEAAARSKMATAVVVQQMRSLFGTAMTPDQATAVSEIVNTAMTGLQAAPAPGAAPVVGGGGGGEEPVTAETKAQDLDNSGTLSANEKRYNQIYTMLQRYKESGIEIEPARKLKYDDEMKALKDKILGGKKASVE